MDVRLTWTDCDEAGDYVVPNVLSQRDLFSRPDNMDATVLHTSYCLSQTDFHKTGPFSIDLNNAHVHLRFVRLVLKFIFGLKSPIGTRI